MVTNWDCISCYRTDELHVQKHGHCAVGLCGRFRAVESEAKARVPGTEAARVVGRTEIQLHV